MADAISQQLRREIRARANGRCEYCLILESLLLAGCEVDHIVSRKHGGLTELSNLALSCARCNRAKGTDVGSIHTATRSFIRLFNPRLDRWEDHFVIEGARIIGLTPIGQVTAHSASLERRRETCRTQRIAAGRKLSKSPRAAYLTHCTHRLFSADRFRLERHRCPIWRYCIIGVTPFRIPKILPARPSQLYCPPKLAPLTQPASPLLF